MSASVDLYWIPLGAGGRSVRFNGKVYEAITAAMAKRPRQDIYHSALMVHLRSQDIAIEMTPVPRSRPGRGVVAEGAVGTRWAGCLRLFRYEVRRWPDGVVPDLCHAVMRLRLTDDETLAQRILDVLPSVPTPVWGRDELGVGEMWTCNSVISWALTCAGLDAPAIPLPAAGRAPGWDAGIATAGSHPQGGAATDVGTSGSSPPGPPDRLWLP